MGPRHNPPTMPGRRAASAALVLGCLALAGCTSDSTPARPDASASPTAAGSVNASPTPLPASQVQGTRVFDDPATSTSALEEVATLEYTPELRNMIETAGDSSSFATGAGVVFTPQATVIAASSQLLTALDPATGQAQWHLILPERDRERHSICRIVHPTPDSDVIVAFAGGFCGYKAVIDIETGKLLSMKPVGDGLLPSIDGPATVGGFTYLSTLKRAPYSLTDSVYRLNSQGNLVEVLDAEDLNLGADDSIFGVDTLAGSNKLLITISPDGQTSLLQGRYIGAEVLSDGSLRVAWVQSRKKVAAAARPQATMVASETGGLMYPTETLDEGVAFLSVIRKGVPTPRISAMDPETGLMTRGLALPQNPPGGFPIWAGTQAPPHNGALLVDDQLFSIAGPNKVENLVRYDLARNKIAWVFAPQFKTKNPAIMVAGVIGVSADRGFVYAFGRSDFDSRIYKLDYNTGKPVDFWQVPDEFSFELDGSDMYLNGSDVLFVNDPYYDFDEAFAGLLRFN